MPKRSSKPPSDPNVAARRVVSKLTGEDPIEETPPKKKQDKNPAAVALGRLGGKKGGKARAAKLTPEERKAIAKKAAESRWRNKTEDA